MPAAGWPLTPRICVGALLTLASRGAWNAFTWNGVMAGCSDRLNWRPEA